MSLTLARGADDDVGGRNVAMHDLHRLVILVQRFIHIGQRRCHLGHDVAPYVELKDLPDFDGATS